ncbi:hypothetical protein GCM10008014_39080 [Paenibacillus silvae]|uniref:Radical SAM protein n=1 Tax=Paenibacillus silvae TaxID=1325358 RepID=A0ABQ1ZIF4_9BACL|nr:radical SAM/SPASM domain-containing protein [Paenibacillus silvae]GGH62537.1 hypothetical protein GCM10008014_39080 [Paenibacillus silvae]
MLSENFKDNICIVEIENSSFCNRRCSYCINYHVDRITEKNMMPYEIFKKIVDELNSINYDRLMTFHRYNEPFAFKNDMILERISYARRMLPDAVLATSSNGDYLDPQYLSRIQQSGLNELYLQCHLENYSSYTIDDIKNKILLINQRIGGFKGKFVTTESSCVYVTVDSKFDVLTIQAKNFADIGYPRGEIVENVKKEVGSGPCFQPLTSFTIDYNGCVTMCCNTVSYYNQHSQYVLGNCKEQTIFDIYNSDRAVSLRGRLLEGIREKVCMHCTNDGRGIAERFIQLP